MKPLAYVMLARAFLAFGCVVLVFGVAAYACSAGFGSIVPAVVTLVAAVILYVTSFGWYFGFVRASNRARVSLRSFLGNFECYGDLYVRAMVPLPRLVLRADLTPLPDLVIGEARVSIDGASTLT